jgi:hypothetical protein
MKIMHASYFYEIPLNDNLDLIQTTNRPKQGKWFSAKPYHYYYFPITVIFETKNILKSLSMYKYVKIYLFIYLPIIYLYTYT